MKLYNLNELTDSKVLYDENPPKFMMYIIAIVTILLALFFVWTNKSIKTYIVKGQGIVTTENKSQIMAALSGAIVEVNTLEDKKGEKVNLILGMVTETRVKYEKITYMKYFMEQIGIKLN